MALSPLVGRGQVRRFRVDFRMNPIDDANMCRVGQNPSWYFPEGTERAMSFFSLASKTCLSMSEVVSVGYGTLVQNQPFLCRVAKIGRMHGARS